MAAAAIAAVYKRKELNLYVPLLYVIIVTFIFSTPALKKTKTTGWRVIIIYVNNHDVYINLG